MTYPAAPGRKQTVTERGWFAPPFTACRFAVEAQIELRMGRDLPLDRQPNGTPNAVRDIQLAGDNTPKTGSTIGQGQKGIRTLIPDSDMKWGTMTEAEIIAAVHNGATVGFGVDCGKLPAYLKNFVGHGYNGGHYVCIDGAYDDGTVDLNDPMFAPAKLAHPRRVPLKDVMVAVTHRNGQINVTPGYENITWLKAQLAEANAQLDAAQAVTDAANAAEIEKEKAVAALEAQIAAIPA